MKHSFGQKLTSIVLVVMMVVSMVPAFVFSIGAAGEATYVKTELADIKETDTVLIVATKDAESYAMSNDQGTSKGPSPVSVTITDNAITTDATNILWNITNDGGNLTIYPAGTTETWLYCTSTNNGVRVGTNANKIFTIDESSGYLKNTATSRYLGVYNAQDWRCYTSSTATNIKDQTFSFYKLQEAKHEHAYAWDGNIGADGSHTMTCANTDGKCDALTTTNECTWEDGYCAICGAQAPACAHPTTTEVAEVPATCTEIGYTAGVQCTVCNQYTSGHEEIPVLGHHLVTDAAVPATCTEPGLTEGSRCDRKDCGHVEVAQTVVDALGHNYVNGVCDREGCGAVAPLEYTFDYTTGTNQTVMTGVQEGLVTLVFDKATGSTAPTWYSNGTALRFYKNNNLKISTVDGYYIKSIALTITTGALNVDTGTLADGAWTPADKETSTVIFTPSETTRVQGIAIELVAICKHTNTDKIGDAKPATCTEDGITAGLKCIDCGEILEAQKPIEAIGHRWENGVCINEGCGEIQCDHIDKGITLGEITKKPTCTETGLQERFCAQCNQPLADEILDMVAHTPVTDAAVLPTCIATGLTEGSHCSVCDKVLVEQTVVDMIDHDYVDNQCTVCGDIIVTGSQLADFEFGTDGGDGEGTKAISAGVIETYGSYKLNFTTATNVYDKSYDAKGNAVLKLGTSSKVGVFEFTVPANVNTVVIYVAGRQAKDVGITVNDTDYTITTHSNDGAYTKIVVDTTETKTVRLTTSTNYRAMVNSIEFWGDPAPAITTFGLTLNKGVTVKVAYDIPEAWLALNTGAEVIFSNGTKLEAKAGLNTYSTTLTPAQINTELTVTLKVGEREIIAPVNVSVAKYIELATPSASTELKALLDSIVAYGQAADKTLGTDLEAPSFDKVAETDTAFDDTIDAFGTVSATLADAASVKVNVNTAAIEADYTLTVTLGGKALLPEGATAGEYITKDNQIVINGLYPANFNDSIVITIFDATGAEVATASFTLNAYLKALYHATADQATKNLVAATYNYGVAAQAYKNAQ